jgi:hypothetical protein
VYCKEISISDAFTTAPKFIKIKELAMPTLLFAL